MKKLVKSMILTAAIAGYASVVTAGPEWARGSISALNVYSGGVMFKMSPNCASGFILRKDAENYHSKLSMLLIAYESGRILYVHNAGGPECTTSGWANPDQIASEPM